MVQVDVAAPDRGADLPAQDEEPTAEEENKGLAAEDEDTVMGKGVAAFGAESWGGASAAWPRDPDLPDGARTAFDCPCPR